MLIPMLTLIEAQKLRKCRICGCAVKDAPTIRPELENHYPEIPTGQKNFVVVMNYGTEFAHNICLNAWKKANGSDLILSDKMGVITNIGDIRKLIEDLPDSLPAILNFKGRMVTPVFAVETRTDLYNLFNSSALEIRDG